MRKSFLKLFIPAVFFVSHVFAQGGATTIGDGGHVVICRTPSGWSNARLLDLFEAEVSGAQVTFSPENEQTSVLDKVSIGLERLRMQLDLKESDIGTMKLAAKKFWRFQYDPWREGHIFKAKDPVVSQKVYSELTSRDCYLDTIAIHPAPEIQML
jgi:hypothetical protein